MEKIREGTIPIKGYKQAEIGREIVISEFNEKFGMWIVSFEEMKKALV